MQPKRSDYKAIVIFICLIIVLITSAFFLLKSVNAKFFSQIKLNLPVKPTPTEIANTPTISAATPTLRPTATPTVRQNPTPTTKTTSTCHRLKIKESEFASNKCYTQADYNTLVSVLSKYSSAKSQLRFIETSISITCNCQNERSCEFFKDECDQNKSDKIKTETDLNLYRTQIQLLLARGW